MVVYQNLHHRNRFLLHEQLDRLRLLSFQFVGIEQLHLRQYDQSTNLNLIYFYQSISFISKPCKYHVIHLVHLQLIHELYYLMIFLLLQILIDLWDHLHSLVVGYLVGLIVEQSKRKSISSSISFN